MKLSFSKITLFVSVIILFTQCKPIDTKKNRNAEQEDETKLALQDRIDLAWQQEVEMTKDPATGSVPKERLIAAYNYVKAQKANYRINAAISNMNWVNVGPNNFGGRSRAICIDLNDASRKTVFVGSVGGGLWKTTDITASNANWKPVDEFLGNIAISSIAQDPSNPQIMYLGTGEGYGNLDAIRGLGVWKSTNGGTSWTQLSSTNNSNFYYCQKVFVNSSGVVFVGTSSGLYRSTNGGTTFTKVLGTGLGITGASSNKCFDIEATSNGNIYATLAGSIHKSSDGGATFGSALNIGVTATRIEIATAPNNNNYLYALCEYSNAVTAILISQDEGATFRAKTEPADADGGIPATDFSRTQAWYDLTIAVDPNNANTVYVGGVDLFKSTDSCTTWQQISHWYGGFGFQNVHADQHNIMFNPGSSSIIYFLNDGGIYRTQDGTNLIPTITSKNLNYSTLQFYGCAISPTAGSYEFLAGAQDNGSHKFTQSAIHSSARVTGGDGAFCHIDQNQPQYWFTSYVYNNYYRSTDGGNSFSSASYGNVGRFINPTDYDDNANIMYCANGSSNYLRWDNPQTGSTFTSVTLSSLGGTVSAIKVSPNTENRVFFATSGGKLVKADNANTATPTASVISTGLPANYISCIEVETGNDNHILVSYSSYGVNSIWETTNGGTTWTSIEGNLPDMPVRWILFNPNNNNQAVIATELGVWSTDNLNGTSTVWGSSNNGLANVRVDMLQVRQSDKMLIAATHGRGLYYSGVFSPPTANFAISQPITYQQVNNTFINASFNSTSYLWDFGDGNTSTIENPTHKYANAGTYDVTLSINGGASSVIKSITVLPRRATPYTLANGGNFETNTNDFANYTLSGTSWVLGKSTYIGKDGTTSGNNAWVTNLTSTYLDNTTSYLYSPVYNFTNSGTYAFSFYTKYNCELNYDGFIIEYSTDTGKIWQPLGTSVSASWYNFANNLDETAFQSGQAFFTGNYGTAFAKKAYDVSFLGGNNSVSFRFVFKTDMGITAAGVAIDDLEIAGPNNVVPLQLLNFSAHKKDNQAVITWNTKQEKNIQQFILQRSIDGVRFENIYSTKANNSFIAINNYLFTDNLLNFVATVQNCYYRLQIIDNDGKSNYSLVAKISLSNLQSNISVYPNPFTSNINVRTNEKIIFTELLDLNGKVVYRTQNNITGMLFVPNAIANGNYFLRVKTETNIYTQKVTKQ